MLMDSHRAKTLILGVGNILLCDEGIGVRVIEYLQQQTLPESVELVDGGTAGADMIDILTNRETVIIIDAVRSDKPAGTIMRFGPEDLMPQQDNPLSLHELDIPQTLAMTHLLKCAPKNVICIGIVPECIIPGMNLSETLADLVPQISQIVLDSVYRN